MAENRKPVPKQAPREPVPALKQAEPAVAQPVRQGQPTPVRVTNEAPKPFKAPRLDPSTGLPEGVDRNDWFRTSRNAPKSRKR